MKKIITKSEQETLALGRQLARTLKGGEVLALTGELGAGKTIFTKGVVKGLGIKSVINSPTFVLMKIYPVRGLAPNGVNPVKNKNIKQLVHIDCYRITDVQQIAEIGASQYFTEPQTVTIIEWAEKIKNILPKQIIKIKIELKQGNQRKITIN